MTTLDKNAKVPRVDKRYLLVPVGIAGMLAFGLLTGGPQVPMDDYGELANSIASPEETLATTDSTFGGKAVELKGGLSIQTTKLEAVKLSDPSVLEDGSRPQLFNVTIKNDTKKPLDLFNVTILQTDIEGNAEGVCMDVFDETQNIVGVPTDPLAAGKSITFPWAMGCPGKKGAKITITMAVTEEAQVQFTGTLA